MLTRAELVAFEDRVAELFAQGKIRSPVHLSGGNEEQLLDIFKYIKPYDWVFAGWRSHYHCLLKGVPQDKLLEAICAGSSVHLSFPEQKVFCSGICGGIAPIAVGIAWSLKKRNDEDYTGNEERVHVFLGDMSAQMGIVHESMKYAFGHQLPIEWYCEDNGKSVATDTRECWGETDTSQFTQSYCYELTRPHCGVGRW